MFKAIDIQTGLPVVSLDERAAAQRAELRAKGRDGLLRCQTCQEEVLLKAGDVNRPHFAHKTLANCPTQNEPPELLEARAVLYQWLSAKFGPDVTLEHQVLERETGRPAGPRPFDAWVRRKERTFAYWLVDRRMPAADLESIQRAARQAGASLTWVFLAKVQRRLEQDPQLVTLSTTERACIQPSEYDAAHSRSQGSLHYLDAERAELATLRALRCKHEPQVYWGHELRTPLAGVLVYPKTGEFVHPDEHERLLERRRKEQEKEQRRRQQEQEWQRRQEEDARRRRELREEIQRQREADRERQRQELEALRRHLQEQDRQEVRDRQQQGGRDKKHPPQPERRPEAQPRPAERPVRQPDAVPPPATPNPADILGSWGRLRPDSALPDQVGERAGTCIECGRVTTDWWTFDGRTGLCRCNACRRARQKP